MEALRVVITILYIIVCIALVVIVLLQEGKSAGLTGAISGAAETYWGKNKGRSMEGTLKKITKVLAVLFVVLSIVLVSNKW
ncbi:MAG: preprotein translocase subunit SecG [Clostridiales bacterium]|nr:preprotein translocase subunit SecG [Clostridiales bacterium]